jgi:hypothetical protein
MVSRGQPCWAAEIKKELDALGFGYIWLNQGPPAGVELGNLISEIKGRIRDIRFQEQLSEGQTLSSLKSFCMYKKAIGREKKLDVLIGLCPRRQYCRFLLNCPGGLIIRDNIIKKCSKCEQIIVGNIFIHLLINCAEFDKLRSELGRSTYWLDKIS